FDQKNVSVVLTLLGLVKDTADGASPGTVQPSLIQEKIAIETKAKPEDNIEIAESTPAAVPIPPWLWALSDLERVALTVGAVLIPPPTPHRRAPCTHAGPPPLGRRAVVLAPAEGSV
mgnify:CR=1